MYLRLYLSAIYFIISNYLIILFQKKIGVKTLK